MSKDVRVSAALPVALTAVSAGAAIGTFIWGALFERTRWKLRTVEVPVLPAGAAPISVLHLSDLHMAPWQRGKQEWISALAALKPDLVVSTGDMLGHADGLVGLRKALEPLRGIPGVFVNGSNDYFAPIPKNPFGYFAGPSRNRKHAPRLDIDALHAYFSYLGWRDLDNTATSMTINGTNVEFFGVDDPHKRYDRIDLVSAAIDELRGADLDDEITGLDAAAHARATVTIGVAHAPYRRVLNSFVTNGAQMIFAGHTHGGQVCIPGYGALVTNCDIPRKQVKGLSVWHHGPRLSWLNVSAGLGTSIYAPVRFACPPEASLVRLIAVGSTPS